MTDLKRKLIHEVMIMAYQEGIEAGKTEAINVLLQMKKDTETTPNSGLKAPALLNQAIVEVQKR